MSPQDWLDLSAHNARSARPPERRVFGRESEPPRRSLRLGALGIIALYLASGLVAGWILLVAVRYALAVGWPL